jgi:hypothetical protein
MSGANGSGLFKNQAATLAHLVVGGGLGKEIADVRRDVAAVLTPLVAIAIEEYTLPPPIVAAAIMIVTASSLTAQVYQGAGLTGSVGGGKISPPRNIEVVTAGATATHAPSSFVIKGLDAQGNHISETIPGTNGGAATYTGVKCFAQITSVEPVAGTGTDATFSVGTGVVIGLSQTPKIRTLQALPLVRKELYDGSVVTNGLLTLPATNPPFGAYTPNTAPAAVAAATHTGTADITAGSLYGPGGTLDGETIIMNVNGAGALTLTLSVLTNALNEAALLAAILAEWPALTAVQGGGGGNKLVLTTILQGAQASIAVGIGTANTDLGLANATYTGTGHRYSIEYEYDASLQKDA